MRALVLLLAVALPAVAAPVPKGLKKGPPPMPVGVFELVEFYQYGERGNISAKYWRVDGDRMTGGKDRIADAVAETRMCTLRPRDPAHPELRELVWDDSPAVSHSTAVEWDADRLSLTVGLQKGLVVSECKPQNGTFHYVFKRVTGEK